MPSGTVAVFDDGKGFGTVRDADTGDEYFFHCSAIADGSRMIDVGASVTFEVVAGGNGKWEARAITPSGDAGSR
ncbi:MAG TPA: cold shock domain-containing protein [Acidimicrobiales bacterium]|jgi:cold shock CspA family protein